MCKLIQIELFGGYAHSDGGHEALPRKSRALLAYLVMQGARGASREHVADLLWDFSDPAKARHSLRQCLVSVRRTLGDRSPGPIAAIDHNLLAARASAFDVDVHRFEALSHSASLADLAAAADLYRAPFLADFDAGAEPFAAWTRGERERLEGVAAQVLRRLAAASSQAGDLQRAIAAAKRLAALDPLNEDDQHLLMRLLASAGRRVEAMRQFEALKGALRAELGVTPNEASRALARALRAEEPAASEVADETQPQPAAAALRGANVLKDQGPRAGDEAPEPSVRSLTVLACEWLGIEALPGDKQYEAGAGCYRRCGEWLEARGAHVARNASDGVVAYFGFLQNSELDAETGARSAIGLRALAAELSREFGTTISFCAGVACGPVVVQAQPHGKSPEAIGSALGLACRLKDLAGPGEILIESGARNLVRGLFDYGETRSLAFKGFLRPVEVSPLLGEAATESRFEALRPTRLSPMVGREEEMERLLRRWKRAVEGDGAVVLLIGDPGIGKSRLVKAFVEQLGGESGSAVRAYCSPYGGDSALHPFIPLLKAAAGIGEADSPGERRAKLAATIADAGLPSNMLAWLAPLVGVSDESRAAISVTPALGREKMLKALASLIEARAAANSLAALVVVEDIHSADPTTIELLETFAELAPQRRLLLIATSRPEFTPFWDGRAGAATISLGRLSAREAARIVVHATASSPLPPAAVDRIVTLAEGVPLFLEELSLAFVEQRAASPEERPDAELTPCLPETLQALLRARFDRLGGVRPVAQIAAALGRTFNRKLLAAASGIAEAELDGALAKLVQSEWLWRRGAASEGEYMFRHALLQDVAYHSLPREPRRALHERLTTALETHCAAIVDAQPEMLARHCAEAGLSDKGARLWTKAGQLSLAQSALQEALAQFERALAILSSLPSDKPRRALQLAAQIGLANALMHTKGYAAPETRAALDQARRFYTRAEELGEPPEDPSLLLAVLHGFWVASHVAFDGPTVRELSLAFMSLVRKQRSSFAHAIAHRIMGTSLLFLGDFAGGRTHLDRAYALYDPAAHRPMAARFGQDIGVAVLSNRPLALWLLGYPDEAAKECDDAIVLARSVGQAGTLLYMLTRIAWIKLVSEDFAGAEALIQELTAIAADVEGAYWTTAASLLHGCRAALIGDPAVGVALIGAGVAPSRTRGERLLRLPWYFGCLARAHARLGEFEAARLCLEEAFAAVARTEEAWPEAELHRLAGELALSGDDPDPIAASKEFERALALARRQQAKSFELRAAINLARLRRDAGEPRRALAIVEPVYRAFAQGLTTTDLAVASSLIAELAARNGHSHEDHRSDAHAVRVG